MDQLGFVPGREGRDNTQRVLNAIHYAQFSHSPLVLFSTDTEKAFDRVDWIFLNATLEHIGLRSSMQKWVNALYSTSSAKVKVNKVLSDTFQICNGMRQGCPLSPLIFILTLEPLLKTVRAHPDIKGIKTRGHEHNRYISICVSSVTHDRG